MKKYLFALTAIVCGLFLTMSLNSCGIDDDILDVDDVEKTDLTYPLFLAYDNTIDSNTKKIWAFNDTEAAMGTVSLVGSDVLRIRTEAFYNSWSISNKKINLGDKKSYGIKKVIVLGYNAIAFSNYICIPSSNKSLDGAHYEDEWFRRGLTEQAFWDALHKSNTENINVDIKLDK
jgi:hypothetical protein